MFGFDRLQGFSRASDTTGHFCGGYAEGGASIRHSSVHFQRPREISVLRGDTRHTAHMVDLKVNAVARQQLFEHTEICRLPPSVGEDYGLIMLSWYSLTLTES